MRYRIQLDGGNESVEVTSFDLRVIGQRRVAIGVDALPIPHVVYSSGEVLLGFGAEIVSITDDHDRTIYER